MAESLGQHFSHARQEKGWTLDQAAAKTRIQLQYLKAVEEDNYAQLPEEVFAKGFVRSYARMLGLDEMEVMRRFNESGGQFYAKRAEREQLKQQLQEEERRKKANQLMVAGVVGVVFVVLLLVIGQGHDRIKPMVETPEPSPENSVPASPPAAVEPRPSPRAVLPVPPEPLAGIEAPMSEPAPPTPVGVEPAFSADLPLDGIAPDGEKLVLDVEALERAWLLVKADHGAVQDVMLLPGEHVRWSAKKKLMVTLGNAGGVRISLNGKRQGPYGASGQVVKDLVFTR
jgi:cytoskeleton protein RodZ